MTPKPRARQRDLAAAEGDLAALNKELAWELSKAAVDVAGIADPTPISDGLGAAMSLAEGDFIGAGLSLISMVPYAGDALGKSAKAARAAKKLEALRKKIAAATAEIEHLRKTEKALKEGAEKAAKASKKAPAKKPKPCSPCLQPPASKGVNAKHKGWGRGQIPCFPSGTLIATPAGLRPIEFLHPGAEVEAYDFYSGRTIICPILATYQGNTDCWIEIVLENEQLTTTREHLFWVEQKGVWKPAKSLSVGTKVRLRNGLCATITGLASHPQLERQPTYNLTVAGANNFFVGQLGVLVHNNNSRLNRPGYRNYVLVDRNGKVYYSGMHGPNQTAKDVQRRHAANRDRFNPAKGDRMVTLRGTRTYGEARRLEYETAIKNGTYTGRNQKTSRGNRQYPMSEKKFSKYYPKDAC